MSFASLLNTTVDVYEVAHTKDLSGGMIKTAGIEPVLSGVRCRHKDALLPLGDPSEIGGAPTLVNAHVFVMLPQETEINAGHVLVDADGKVMRVVSTVNKRRGAGTGIPTFWTVTAMETA